MVLQSGLPPYEYAVRKLPFRVPDPTTDPSVAIGPSGILLEQAQFVITAERRRFNKAIESHILPDFNLYVNDNISAVQYEPKADGSTLPEFPGSLIFVDYIEETRAALEDLFTDMSNDTAFGSAEIKADWLQNLYFAPSGFLADQFGTVGNYIHRIPSEFGPVLELAPDVLGASGVLYDVDFGELMWNPYPYITNIQFADAHGKTSQGFNDRFNIQAQPVFPAFQTTAGGLIDLTGREPTSLSDAYTTSHISSNTVRLDGYMLTSLTKYRLGTGFTFDQTDDFTFSSVTTRPVPAPGNLDLARAFLTPKAQTSGVYKILAMNERADFPDTAVESGTISVWPRSNRAYPAGGNQAATSFNLGYHVYNDAIWITDNSVLNGTDSKPSGLAILSPYTGHFQWVRYAELVNDTSTSLNWPDYVGLERTATNTVYRVSPTIVKTLTAVSGHVAFQEFDDMLDYTGETLTTSTVGDPANPDEFPLGGDPDEFADMCFDGSNYWVTNNENVGFDVWRFNSSFVYTGQFIVVSPDPVATGTFNTRMAFVDGALRVYRASIPLAPTLLNQSGIYTVSITEPSDIGGNDAAQGGTLDLATPKNINGAPFFGVQLFAEIFDLFEVSGASHVDDGVYCLIRFQSSSNPASTKRIHLIRIVESTTTWEIVAVYQLVALNTSTSFLKRYEMLFMPI
jgi:hypothetical protein